MTDLNKQPIGSLRAKFEGKDENSIWIVSQKRLFASERIDPWLKYCTKEMPLTMPVYELVLVCLFETDVLRENTNKYLRFVH